MTNANILNRMNYAERTFHIGSSPTKENTEKAAEPTDKVEIKGESVLRKAGKYALGAGIATAIVPLNVVVKSVEGSIYSALKGLDIEGSGEGTAETLAMIAITVSPLVGIAAGASLGIPGIIAGMVLTPGVVGGLIAGAKGTLNMMKNGVEIADILGNAVENKSAPRIGKTAGKAVGIASKVALGALSIPLSAIAGPAVGGFEFALKAIGFDPEKEGAMKEPSGAAKLLTQLGGIGGLTLAAPKVFSILDGTPALLFSTGSIGACMLAAGVGSAVAATGAVGITAGAKALIEGVKESKEIADEILR